jgi:hypothetical protein
MKLGLRCSNRPIIGLAQLAVENKGRPQKTILDTQGLQSPANSAPLRTGKKVANHSPWTPRGKQSSSKDIWSGGFPFLSNTFTHLHRGHFGYACTWRFGLLPDRVLKYYLFEDLTVQMYGFCIECAVDGLAVPSDEHTPLSEIVVWLQGSKKSSPPVRMT